MVRKNNWIKQKLLKMQKPTTLATTEQVSVEVDEKLHKATEESTLKNPSTNNSKSNKPKLDLAQLISQSSK